MRSRLMHTPVFSLPADCPPLCRWFCAPHPLGGACVVVLRLLSSPLRESPLPGAGDPARALF